MGLNGSLTTRKRPVAGRRFLTWRSRLEEPLSPWWCAFSWVVASATFFELIRLLGGVTTGDASDSVNTTWALAHGMPSCGYAPGNQFGLPYTGPLYPLLSGGLAALFRIGDSVPFPTRAQLGPHCSTAIAALYHWSLRSHALLPTVQIGYVAWLVLLGGVVALLRASGRGRCGWEVLTVAIVAIVPPVSMCLHEYFHPQDLTAMGLILAGIACVRRGWWVSAGVLLGLAFTAQQFTIVAFAPLLVLAPRERWTRFVGAAVAAVVVVVGPLVAFLSTRALSVAIIGSGDASVANTVLGEVVPHGRLLLFLSRFLPIVSAMVVAWWVSNRVGSAVFAPLPLISLMAISLTFRLVFEVNLWGYYFMAVSVLLVMLDVVRGRINVLLVVWLALVVLAFSPTSHGVDAFRTATPLWLPLWSWQLLLVPPAFVFAARPLLSEIRLHPRTAGARGDVIASPLFAAVGYDSGIGPRRSNR